MGVEEDMSAAPDPRARSGPGDGGPLPRSAGVQGGAAVPGRPTGIPTAISADLLRPLPKGLNALLLSLIGMVGAFILWAANATLQETTKGRGRVIPASKIQLVQNLEGGIIRKILVREGATVRAGDVLLRIDPTQAGSSLGKTRQRMRGLQALIARLEAEVEGRALSFPRSLEDQGADFLSQQRDQFEERKRELNAGLSALDYQAEQRAQELVELNAKIDNLKASLAIAAAQLAMIRPLARSHAASRADLLSARAKVNDIKGALRAAQLAVPRVRAQHLEVLDRRKEKLSAFRAEALKKLSNARVELSVLTESGRGAADTLARTIVRAPVAGIVKTVHVTTPGQVVKPGSDLVEIVPLDDALLIEARVRPRDIAFLRPGQKAIVKLTAYDFALYGGLKGKLEGIGADSITNKRGETYYVIRVRTSQSHLAHGDKALPILPGMVAEVDILTGSKTVLAYLTKPLTRMRHDALRER